MPHDPVCLPRRFEIDKGTAGQHAVALIIVPALKSVQKSENTRDGKAPSILQLREQGLTPEEIAMEVGVSRQRVGQVMQENCENSQKTSISQSDRSEIHGISQTKLMSQKRQLAYQECLG